MKILLVKLGGSLITDKNKAFSEKLGTIRRLAKEIHTARVQKESLIIVGHGAGSYAHVPAMKYKTMQGVINQESLKGIAEVQDAAARLNRIVTREFVKAGENAVSLSPSSFMIASNYNVKRSFLDPLYQLLKLNMLPVVYGDVVLDSVKGCCILSTEKVLAYLAVKLKKEYKVSKLIYCGITNGVHDREGNTVPRITKKNFVEYKQQIGVSEGIDVTGGMMHKVEEALDLAGKGIKSVIINGSRKGELLSVLQGEKFLGTTVL